MAKEVDISVLIVRGSLMKNSGEMVNVRWMKMTEKLSKRLGNYVRKTPLTEM